MGYIVKNDRLAVDLPEAVEKALRDYILMKAIQAVRESEAFYYTLFNESSQALFIETPDGIIEDTNRAACKMLGYELDELKGKSALDLVPPDRKEEYSRAISTLIDGREIQFENVRKDGSIVPVEVTASEVVTRRGTRYVVEAKDVSENLRTKRALENERAFTEDALNAIADIFVVADLSGSFYKWNRCHNEVTGYSDQEIDAMRTFEFFSPDDFLKLKASVETVAQTGDPQKFEASLISKEGRSIPYEMAASLMSNSEGKPLGIPPRPRGDAGTGRDVSGRKRAEEALRNVTKETNEHSTEKR